MRLLITGAGGFAGSYLSARLRDAGETVVSLGIGSDSEYDVDIRDADEVARAFRDARIDGVFHLAAVAYVPDAHDDPGLADAVNRGGPRMFSTPLTPST